MNVPNAGLYIIGNEWLLEIPEQKNKATQLCFCYNKIVHLGDTLEQISTTQWSTKINSDSKIASLRDSLTKVKEK